MKSGSGIIYSAKPEWGRFIVASHPYEDIRIDANLDGEIDYWHLKSDGLTVEVIFKNSLPSLYTVRKVSGSNVSEFGYQIKGQALKLLYARTRKLQSFNYDERSEFISSCQETMKDLTTQLGKFSKELNEDNIYTAIDNGLIDESCGDQADALGESIAKALEKEDKISKCLSKGGKFRKSLPPGADNDLLTEVLSAQFELQKRQLVEDNVNHKSTFVCKNASEKNTVQASTREDGIITFSLPINEASRLKVVQHELVHRAGPYSEDITKKLISVCVDNEKQTQNLSAESSEKSSEIAANTMVGPTNGAQTSSFLVNTASQEGAKVGNAKIKEMNSSPSASSKELSKSSAGKNDSKNFNGVTAAAENSTATIPKELTVAQTSIPSSESVSSSIYNPPPSTDEGAKIALNNSYSQSAGVFKTANNLIGSMNSPALANDLAANKAAVSNGMAELAVNSSAAMNTRLPASASAVGLKGTSVKSNEVITEEVTLGNQPEATSRSQASVTTDNRAPASVSRSDMAAQATRAVPTTASNTSSGGETASSASVNPGSSGSQLSLGSGSQNIQRQPASRPKTTTSSSSSGSSELSREQIITFISSGNFEKARQKLRDPDFASQLKSQKVKVLDTYGNAYGAEKGDVIFLENEREQRFVRKK